MCDLDEGSLRGPLRTIARNEQKPVTELRKHNCPLIFVINLIIFLVYSARISFYVTMTIVLGAYTQTMSYNVSLKDY